VPIETIGAYGCAEVAGERAFGAHRIVSCEEKPEPCLARSNFALCGRYVLSTAALDELDHLTPDRRGELQLTPAIDRVARTATLLGLEVTAPDGRVDVGNWLGWLDANRSAFAPEAARAAEGPPKMERTEPPVRSGV
jgi:UTP--glucose-1-phosphate uridylyltransferase